MTEYLDDDILAWVHDRISKGTIFAAIDCEFFKTNNHEDKIIAFCFSYITLVNGIMSMVKDTYYTYVHIKFDDMESRNRKFWKANKNVLETIRRNSTGDPRNRKEMFLQFWKKFTVLTEKKDVVWFTDNMNDFIVLNREISLSLGEASRTCVDIRYIRPKFCAPIDICTLKKYISAEETKYLKKMQENRKTLHDVTSDCINTLCMGIRLHYIMTHKTVSKV